MSQLRPKKSTKILKITKKNIVKSAELLLLVLHLILLCFNHLCIKKCPLCSKK